jgi:hypothetical protein
VKLTDSDERTPTAEPVGRCPRCQRPTTLCDGHPTAEPVTEATLYDLIPLPDGPEKERTMLAVMEWARNREAEAAQRSTAEVERAYAEYRRLAIEEVTGLRAEVERLRTLLRHVYTAPFIEGHNPVICLSCREAREAINSAALAEPDHDGWCNDDTHPVHTGECPNFIDH